ncbi:MAG: PKD domain-containing protein [Chloroflexia bacterium]|nr:PKD domain-containing protein [Chloroflexia bacterium]
MKRTVFMLVLLLVVSLLAPASGAQGPQPGPTDPSAQVSTGAAPPPEPQALPEMPVGSLGGGGTGAQGLKAQAGGVLASWELLEPSPTGGVDSAVVWAIHDGGLWVISGEGSAGLTQRYDPATDTWTTHTSDPDPEPITYPGEACYGLNSYGQEIAVLFPDATGTPTNELRVYNISTDSWSARSIPGAFPADGLWGMDIVSMYGINGQNVCYLSGGSSLFFVGGNSRVLWEYHPDDHVIVSLGEFTYMPTGINLHASWYVPWIGLDGAICIAGGVQSDNTVYGDSQCYDLGGAWFRMVNVDLGPLPEPRWGMADGWKYHQDRYQIWLANGGDGVGSLFAFLQSSVYLDRTTPGFVYGPIPAVATYRQEGDGVQGDFYVEQGSTQFFPAVPATYNQHLLQDDEIPCEPEVLFQEDFEQRYGAWWGNGLWHREAMTETCGASIPPFPDGTHAAYYGLPDVCTYEATTLTGNLNLSYLVDLTYHTSASLSFWSYEETECGNGNCGFDRRYVEISTDLGASWHILWGSGGPEGSWYQARANLTPYAGQPVVLRFRFDAVDSLANNYFGWMVDDIEVVGCRSCQERWISETPLPDPRMDAAILEVQDLLMVLGGYGSGGSSYIYMPSYNLWIPMATMSPEIEFPVDGALGLGPNGYRAFILDDKSSGVDGAMIYDFAAGAWINDTAFPVPGRWAPDMAYDPEQNLIYISGGATAPGSGDLDELWIYDPLENTAVMGPAMSTERDFHASWYVPWLGEQGYVCVAGGTKVLSGVLDSTQCYDIAAGSWNAENADLGPLPVPWWGMGDAAKSHDGCPQLWLTGGVLDPGGITTKTLYFDLCDMDWHWGEELPYAVYRTESASSPAYGEVYQLGGSIAGFGYQPFNQHHLQPCPAMGALEGYVLDAETGCLSATCEPAYVEAFSWAKQRTFYLPLDPAGYYSASLEVGPYQVSAAAAGYGSVGPYALTVTSGMTTVQDFCLPRPVLQVAPLAISVSSYFSLPLSVPLTVDNLGGLTLSYDLYEITWTVNLASLAGADRGMPGARADLLAGLARQGLLDGLPERLLDELGLLRRVDDGQHRSGPAPAGPMLVDGSVHMEPNGACVVAVTAEMAYTETRQLHRTLEEFGYSWVDVYSVGEARLFEADVIIDRYGGWYLPVPDLDDWLSEGHGLVQLGDWPDWFPNDWEGQPSGTPLDVTVVDPDHPLTAGLPATWTGLGFWAYDWTSDAVGWVTDTLSPNLIEASYGTPHERVLSYAEPDPGRAVYIGLNVYGDLAGEADKRILQNALTWSGRCGLIDLPWVREDPVTGTVAPSDSQVVDLTFHCSITDGAGIHTGTLLIEHNDPCAESIQVPLVFECLGECTPVGLPDFGWEPISPTMGQVLTLTAVATGSSPLVFAWDLGDGSAAGGPEVTHVYTMAGTYGVVLTVTNPCGEETVSQDVVVVQGLRYVYLPLIFKNVQP